MQTKLVPGVGRMPYPAYRGNEPYVFVSYAHLDSERVFAEIARFNEAGFHVWYDEGIAPGNEWSDAIAQALSGAAVFVVMLTPTSAPRENVLNEIDYALNEKKPFLAIYLEETQLTPGLKLRISRKQAILKYNMTEEEYEYKYIEAFTRFGLNHETAAQSAGGTTLAEDVYHDSPEDARKRANGDLVRVDGFDIEHGLLRGYYGSERNIKVPRAAGVISSRAFEKCRLFIESVDLNNAGMIIGTPFSNCPSLREVRIPQTVREVRPDMFSNCPNLTLYVRRSQLTEDFERHFSGKGIIYLDENEKPADQSSAASLPEVPAEQQDGFLVDSGILKGYKGTEKNLKLPDCVTILNAASFRDCRGFIEAVDLNNVSVITAGTFADCPRLLTVRASAGLKPIYPHVFSNSPNVTLYIRKSQLQEGFEQQFDGKEIVYLDE
ncbi:MAG: TIR domain-containing protein [Erysipelotrichaceae bacterium]|nr:TIR domain-containing protein [Erysipelotrichaceae bacterium]